MSAYIFYIKQNDRRPNLVAHLKNADGTPLDLTTATSVKFIMSKQGAATPKINKVSTTVSSATGGIIEYHWVDGDTDTIATYRGEFEVTWATGITQTLPEDDYIKIVVMNDLA